MTHAYNCTKHASTTYSPYYLMFGRHHRLPIDVEFGLPKSNSCDNSSKSRYVQKLRRLNYAFQKATKIANQQANKYKSSYDKSIRGPQLQEKDIVLVKIVAHKSRHKLQDKWEPEEYVVVEQPIAGTPVYRVQPVTGGKIRTLRRNLLLPLGVKLEHDNGKKMQSINSEADSLVDTKELLEFIDTMDVGDASKVDESESQEESVHNVTRQDDVDPKSESQFSSFMSYHEGESSSLDPGTIGKELSKSPN